MPFTQEQIDKLVTVAQELCRGHFEDLEVDPINVAEQEYALSPTDDGAGVWVRAWVYVRTTEAFGAGVTNLHE